MASKNDFVSDKRVYADRDGNVVDAKDPNRARLVVAEGGTLSHEEALKYGLVKEGEEAESPESSDSSSEGAIDPEAESERIQASAGGASKRGRKGGAKK
jgi:hypothetical protein